MSRRSSPKPFKPPSHRRQPSEMPLPITPREWFNGIEQSVRLKATTEITSEGISDVVTGILQSLFDYYRVEGRPVARSIRKQRLPARINRLRGAAATIQTELIAQDRSRKIVIAPELASSLFVDRLKNPETFLATFLSSEDPHLEIVEAAKKVIAALTTLLNSLCLERDGKRLDLPQMGLSLRRRSLVRSQMLVFAKARGERLAQLEIGSADVASSNPLMSFLLAVNRPVVGIDFPRWIKPGTLRSDAMAVRRAARR